MDSNGNGEYRSKVETTFTKYVYSSSYGWIATTTSGTKYYYGQVDASRQSGPQGVFKWCLDRVQDTNGNYMTINYSKDQGQIYLDRIDYTGNTATSITTNYYVKFYLEDRYDKLENCSSKFCVKTNKRLAIIDIQSNIGGRVRCYKINYITNNNTGRSLLSSIAQYGNKASIYYNGTVNGTILHTNTFSWTYEPCDRFTFVYAKNGLPGFDLKNTNDRVVPFNYYGDLHQQLLFYRPGSGIAVIEQLNDDNSFTNLYSTSAGISGFDLKNTNDKIIPLNYDGSGYRSLLLYRPGTGIAYIVRSNGDGSFTTVFSPQMYGLGIGGFDLLSTNDKIIPFDFDGDGRQDLVLYRPGSGAIVVARSIGNGSFSNVYYSLNGIAGFDLLNSNDQITPIDYDGDGRQELLVYRPGTGIAVIVRINGDGTITPVFSTTNGIAGTNFVSGTTVVPYDYNGDGLTDLLIYAPGSYSINTGGTTGAAYIARSNGDGTFTQVFSPQLYGYGIGGCPLSSYYDQIIPFEFNQNGIQDLLIYTPNSYNNYVIHSNGNGSFCTASTQNYNYTSTPRSPDDPYNTSNSR